MTQRDVQVRAPEWLIIVGSSIFIFGLAISAIVVPDIRWLHVFQAAMYIVTIILSVRGSRWGHFVGISAAGLWNYLGAFASPLFVQFFEQPTRPDSALQMFAWVGNVLVVIGCLWAYRRRVSPSRADIVRFVATFGLTIGYLAVVITVFAPPYLKIFPASLHPHWPWVGR